VTDPNERDLASELALAHAELSRRQRFTDALLETIDVGIVSCDADGNFVVSNRAQRELFGFRSALHGLWMGDIEPHVDVFDAEGNRLTPEQYPLMRTLQGTLREPVHVRVGPAGGPYRDVVVRGAQIHDDAGELIGAVAALTDVTDLTLAEHSATRANAFLEAVLTASPDYTFVTDVLTGAVIYESRNRHVLGGPAEQLPVLAAGAADLLVHPDDRERLRAHDAAAAELADGSVVQIRYRGMHPDGGWRWLHRRSTPFRRDESGRVVAVVAVVRDISDVVDAENVLTHAAQHDSLTGLPNRGVLMDRLAAALARSERDGREVAVLYIDLDGFKAVNDTAGHAAGDSVLLETARRLVCAVRPSDTVARVGGDEFVIVVEPWERGADDQPTRPPGNVGGDDLALQIAARVAGFFLRPVVVDGVEHVVTASIGVSYATRAAADAGVTATVDSLLRAADAAMYIAKSRGRGSVIVHDPPVGGAVSR
jgi:PAS domain S-box-containing protein